MKKNNIYFHSECSFQLPNEAEIAQKLCQVLILEKKDLDTINFIFCDDEYLLNKNITFLSHDSYTDIITFDYSKDNLVCADIFISIERVRENSLTFKSAFNNELERVMIHGVLHLSGYDDKTKKDKDIMREKENFYLTLND